jgi:hypothetical protein
MNLFGAELESAARRARDGVAEAAVDVSAAQTIKGGAMIEPSMRKLSERRLFEEAVLSAAQAHINEIKIASR